MHVASFAALIGSVLAATAQATTIPHEHHVRFLAEFDVIAQELAAWKNSPAGRYAKANNLYTDTPTASPINPLSAVNSTLHALEATDDQLLRFFLSKLTAEAAQLKNPGATFGTSSPFSLMTESEFAKYVSKSSTLARGLIDSFGATNTTTSEPTTSAPTASPNGLGARRKTTVDWTQSGCVSGVNNQGRCGSCWAFAAVGALESAYCLKYGSLTRFSEQQVTSCDAASHGCDGGWSGNALSYVRDNGGLCTSTEYPYESGSTGETGLCATSCEVTPVTVSSIRGVTASDSGFVSAITKQPVAVAVAAGNPTWKQYTGGVVTDCETTALDHAVLAVGFDAQSFKLKNQWGTAWGAGGYIQLQRKSTSEAACSLINQYAVFPTVE